ncbi:3-deoxy-7-phosphoheptulonate synthase, partial [candidate division KSB1 bacterium]|nr:3-deoxy-7-phosphoheptulonate synthase [candidate division KSB1 bacterium]
MVIVMENKTSEAKIQKVISRLTELGFDIHRSTGATNTVLGAIGEKRDVDIRDIEIMDGVRNVIRITEPYKLVGRTFHPKNSVVNIDGVKIGSKEIVVIAGPCSVENHDQIEASAEIVSKNGAKILRCVGDPARRFEEDKLRVLRAVRFAAELNFEIEEETWIQVKRFSSDIHEVAWERI